MRHVVLLGLMGAGKTSAGRLLARRLGWPFSDSDEWILESTGKTVRRLRDEAGVDAMHAVEAEHLLGALAQPGPDVVGAAASVVEDERCEAALRSPGVLGVWLRAAPETLARRFASASHRPWFGEDPQRFLAAQAVRRNPVFEALSQVVVDVDATTVTQTVASIVAELERRGVRPANRNT